MERKLVSKAVQKDDSRSAHKTIAKWLTEGPPGFSTLIILAGAATIANVTTLIFQQGPVLRKLICAYLALFGLVIVLMELTVCCMTNACKNAIEKWAKFLAQLWGRSLFYIYVGTVQISFKGTWAIIIGSVLILLGLIGVIISRYTAQKMKKLKRLIRRNVQENDPEKIKAFFDMYDKDKSGFIDRRELYELSASLGYPLEGPQLESAVHSLDKDKNGQIEFNEFLQWWTGKGTEMV